VSVGGTGVSVGGTGVSVGGTGVLVGGTGVSVGVSVGATKQLIVASTSELKRIAKVIGLMRPDPPCAGSSTGSTMLIGDVPAVAHWKYRSTSTCGVVVSVVLPRQPWNTLLLPPSILPPGSGADENEKS
jgi:hypothetical protein